MANDQPPIVYRCYRCDRELSEQPGNCPRCKAKLLQWDVREAFDLLRIQDGLLQEGITENNVLTRQAVELRNRIDTLTRQYATLDTLHRDTLGAYFHPQTNSYTTESETVAAGVIGRVRAGWQGSVYRIHEAAEMHRMLEEYANSTRPAQQKGAMVAYAKQLEATVLELQNEIKLLRQSLAGGGPTRAGRSLE